MTDRTQPRRHVFNPLEQRIFGLVQIASGLATVVMGRHAPNWTLAVARWGSKRASRRRTRRPHGQEEA